MSLTSLGQLSRKLERAERMLKEREANRNTDYVIAFSGDTEAEIEARIEARLAGRDPAKIDAMVIMHQEAQGVFVLPGEGDTSENKSPEVAEPSGMIEEMAAVKAAETQAAIEYPTADEQREMEARGIDPPRMGLTKRTDRGGRY